jgi:hypothetical protein
MPERVGLSAGLSISGRLPKIRMALRADDMSSQKQLRSFSVTPIDVHRTRIEASLGSSSSTLALSIDSAAVMAYQSRSTNAAAMRLCDSQPDFITVSGLAAID